MAYGCATRPWLSLHGGAAQRGLPRQETERLVTQTAEMQTMIESAQAETQTLKAALEDAEKAIRRGKRVKQQVRPPM